MTLLWKIMAGMAFVMALFIVSSCHEDESTDDPSNELTGKTEVVKLNKGTDERPNWETPPNLYTSFEQTMSVQVTLPATLLQYAGDDDLMCATVAGEIRAVTLLERTGGQAYFPLVIAGKSGDGRVSLHYYCTSLKRLFTASDWKPFTPGISPTEKGALYVPLFNIPES